MNGIQYRSHSAINTMETGVSFDDDHRPGPWVGFQYPSEEISGELIDGAGDKSSGAELALDALCIIRDIFRDSAPNGMTTTAVVVAHALGAFDEAALCSMAKKVGVSKQALQQRRAWLHERFPLLRAAGMRTDEARQNIANGHRRKKRKMAANATQRPSDKECETIGGSLE